MPLTPEHLAMFVIAASLLTVVPGLDTTLVLRTAIADGPCAALITGAGIALGCVLWGIFVAIGIGTLFAKSPAIYDLLRMIGAAYLIYVGLSLLKLQPTTVAEQVNSRKLGQPTRWLARGFLTNMLNPKVGVFYISFLPQFVEPQRSVGIVLVFLAVVHATIGLAWFLVLTAVTRPAARLFHEGKSARWLSRITGFLFIAFGVRLVTAYPA